MAFKRLVSKFIDMLGNRRGNVAMIFSLSLLPVTLLSGGAVDLSQAMNARSRLSLSLIHI